MALKDVIAFDDEWMNKLMEETVTLRILSSRICSAMATIEMKIIRHEDWDIRAALMPLKESIPKCEVHTRLENYFHTTLKRICESNDPFKMHEEKEKFGIIYHKLMNVEYMFNEKKLENLPIWQSDMP